MEKRFLGHLFQIGKQSLGTKKFMSATKMGGLPHSQARYDYTCCNDLKYLSVYLEYKFTSQIPNNMRTS